MQILRPVVHHNTKRTGKTTDGILLDELGHVCELTTSIARPSTHPLKSSRAKTINSYPPGTGGIYTTSPNLRTYHSHPGGSERFFEVASCTSLAFFACLDIFHNVFIESLPLILSMIKARLDDPSHRVGAE